MKNKKINQKQTLLGLKDVITIHDKIFTTSLRENKSTKCNGILSLNLHNNVRVKHRKMNPYR